VDLTTYLLKGRDILARELKGFALVLCQEAEVRKKVEAEVAKVGGTNYSVAGSMVETGRVIKEVKRLHPVAPMPWRILTQDISIGQTLILTGTRVCLAYHETHQDPNNFTEPTKCDPDRFTKERAEDKKNSGWCYIPHGTGVMAKVHRDPAEAFFAQVTKAFALVLTTKCEWTAVSGQDYGRSEDLVFVGPLSMQIKAK